jgi:hypothetical protein
MFERLFRSVGYVGLFGKDINGNEAPGMALLELTTVPFLVNSFSGLGDCLGVR